MLFDEYEQCKKELHVACFEDDPLRKQSYGSLEYLLDTLPNPQDNLYGLLKDRFNAVLDDIQKNASLGKSRKDIACAINALHLYWKYSGGSLPELEDDRSKVAEGKREDYTKGDEDVIKNFKNQAEAFGIDPKISLGVHMEKQMSAVLNYIRTEGESESEPIIKRVGDTLNYLELLYGIFTEQDEDDNQLIFEPLVIEDKETGEEIARFEKDQMEQTAICEKCQENFDTKAQREREGTAPDFACPHICLSAQRQ